MVAEIGMIACQRDVVFLASESSLHVPNSKRTSNISLAGQNGDISDKKNMACNYHGAQTRNNIHAFAELSPYSYFPSFQGDVIAEDDYS